MTHEEFKRLPFLLSDGQVIELTEYAPRTLRKMVECGHLAEVLPAGATQRRFRKVQVALLAGLEWRDQAEGFRAEPMLMKEKAVSTWTGYAQNTLRVLAVRGKQAKPGALRLVVVRLAGMGAGRFRKVEVAELLGLERYT